MLKPSAHLTKKTFTGLHLSVKIFPTNHLLVFILVFKIFTSNHSGRSLNILLDLPKRVGNIN